jgi:transposase-like protein
VEEKAQAVLAVWTERVKPGEVCRQLGVSWIRFNQWQQRAMEGMLQALETRVSLSEGGALSPRLQQLLAKKKAAAGVGKLEAKLKRLQDAVASPGEAAKMG